MLTTMPSAMRPARRVICWPSPAKKMGTRGWLGFQESLKPGT